MPARSSRRRRRSACRSSTRPNSCAAHAPNPKLASHMSASAHPTAATDGLTIGRGALRQLHHSLLRDAADQAVAILQEAGFAAGERVDQMLFAMVAVQRGASRPGDLAARQMREELLAIFHAHRMGAVSGRALSPAAPTP